MRTLRTIVPWVWLGLATIALAIAVQLTGYAPLKRLEGTVLLLDRWRHQVRGVLIGWRIL